MQTSPETLRRELLPSTQLEELFFDTIVRLATCASFLSQHIERDPEFANAETPRRIRLLLTTEAKLRAAYEEFRCPKVARQLQIEDETQAVRPLLAVVATHTSRTGFRIPPRGRPLPTAFDGQIGQLKLDDASVDAARAAAYLQTIETVIRPAEPGRNAQCPCGSGLKYKRCCASRQMAA